MVHKLPVIVGSSHMGTTVGLQPFIPLLGTGDVKAGQRRRRQGAAW